MKEEKKYFFELKSDELNILSIVLLIIMIGLTFLFIKLFNIPFNLNGNNLKLIYIFLFPYLVIHEILHSIGYVVNGAKFKRITYGIHLEKGILCCTCKQEITKKAVLWSLVYPLLFIGIITYIIGLILNSTIIISLSVINITGCIGDIFMFYNFLKIKDFKFFEYDNPIAFGITTKEDMSKIKMPGLKQIDENDFKQTIGKKITVSKTSMIMLSIYYIVLIAYIFI